jgi:hypothetical protein
MQMNKRLLPLLLCLPLASVAQTYNWSYNLDGNFNDTLHVVEQNPANGDYLIAGRMDFGNFDANPAGFPYPIYGDNNQFVAVYNAAGEIQWGFSPVYSGGYSSSASNKALTFGNTYMSWSDARFTSSGEVVLVGNNDNSNFDFDPIGGSGYTPYAWCYQMILSRYDQTGALQWMKEVGALGQCDYSEVNALALGSADEMYMGGFLYNAAATDFSGSGNYPVGVNNDGAFLSSYDAAGNLNWVFMLGNGYGDEVTALEVLPGGDVVAVGNWFYNPTDFNPLGSPTLLTPVDNSDGFIARYTPAGQLVWALNIGSTLDEFIYDVTVDAAGNIYVVGEFDDSTEFNPLGASTIINTNGQHDAFVAKYDGNGILQWVHTYGDASNNERATGVNLSNGKLMVSGHFDGSVSFGGGYTATALGSIDGYVLQMDPATGTVTDFDHYGGSGTDNVEAAFDNTVAGTHMVFGNFRNNIRLDPATGNITNVSVSGSDMYMASYCYPITVSAADITNLCEGAPAEALNSGTPAGGTYAGIGIINSVFYPLITGDGTFSYTYDYENPYGCRSQAAGNITVNELPVVIQTNLSEFCQNDEPFTLYGGIPSGGTYSGTGVTNGVFDPSMAGPGGYLITYTYTDGTTGCSNSDQAVAIVNASPVVSVSETNSACNQSTGSAIASVAGGVAPFSWYWSNGVVSAANNSIPSGQYQVTVTDGNGCSDFAIATVSDVNGPVIAISGITNTLCPTDTTGAADISVSGGVSPYTYFWSNGKTTQDLSNAYAGTYELTVTDANGCQAVESITIGGPLPIDANAAIMSPSCGNSDGSISLAPLGGSSPFTYMWNDLSTGSSLVNIPLGYYTVAITDANGCMQDFEFAVSESGGPMIAVVSTTESPCNQTLGGVTINPTGNAPFTYSWSDGSTVVSTAQNLTSAAIGGYVVTVTDIVGCSNLAQAMVAPFFPETQICLVTVDTATGTNLVVWEKPVVSYIDGYRIYRESSVSGQYIPVGYVDYADLSQFVDPSANPLVRGWRYKIAAVDLCGNESPLSLRHKTVHLTNSYGTGGQINLSWDDYEGFPFSTFDLWRWTDVDGFTLLSSLPSNLRSYTDLNPPVGAMVYYFIEIVPNTPCVATRAVNHNTTRSNKTQNIASPTAVDEESDLLGMAIYPQPNNGQCTLDVAASEQKDVVLNIFAADGKLVHTQQLNVAAGSTRFQLNLALASGMYQVQITTGDGWLMDKLIVGN